MALKWRDNYIENIRFVPLTTGLKMEGIIKWKGLKSQGPLHPQIPIAGHTLHIPKLSISHRN